MEIKPSQGELVPEKSRRHRQSRKQHERHAGDLLVSAMSTQKTLNVKTTSKIGVKDRQLKQADKVERIRGLVAETTLQHIDDNISTPIKQRKRGKKNGKKPTSQRETGNNEYRKQRSSLNVGCPISLPRPLLKARAEQRPFQKLLLDNPYLNNLDKDELLSFTLNPSHFKLFGGASPYLALPHPADITILTKKRKCHPATAAKPRRPATQESRCNVRSLRLHRHEPPMMHHSNTSAQITFKYMGKTVITAYAKEVPKDEITVMQQHCCGRENLKLFKGMVMKGDNFFITSRRHRAFPFSLTFYLNGKQAERSSTCCEHRYKNDHKLRAKSSLFEVVKVDGSQPCVKCLVSKGKLKTKPDCVSPSKGWREKHPRPQPNYFRGSSNSSVTLEHVQADGPMKASSEAFSSEVSSDSSPLTSADDSESETDSAHSESTLPSLKTCDSSSSESVDFRRPNSVKSHKHFPKRKISKIPNSKP